MQKNKIEPLSPAPSKSQLFLMSLLQNKKRLGLILISFFLFGLLSGLCYYMWDKTKTKSYQDSSIALSPNMKTNLKKFQKIANRYPSLQSQLDAPLAQEYLNLGDLKTSKTLWARVEKRQGALLPTVASYNDVTFLIEEGHYKEALEKSYPLRDKLKSAPQYQALYLSQLLRLIALEEKLGHLDQKRVLLEELAQYQQSEDKEIKQAFELGHLSIAQYLNSKDGLH